jgi:hypothetical protein
MRENTFAEPGAMVLDLDRVGRSLWGIWSGYRRDFEEEPITEVQDLRAFSILWAALFIPEAISSRLRRSLMRVAEQYRERADYSYGCWYRALPIDAAIYTLTADKWWLTAILSNLNHHKRSLREFTIESFAPIAHQLEFDCETLHRIAENIEWRHTFYEWPVILFAGSAERKRQKIEEWLRSYELSDPVLEKLARGELVENPFLHRALRTQHYLTLRMACADPEGGQLTLEDEREIAAETDDKKCEQMKLFDDKRVDLSQVVWDRVRAHPLTASMIEPRDRP